MTARTSRLLLALLAGSLLLTGCDLDVFKLPLPGGADTGDNPITVRARFRDVLDLVPNSTVKVDDVTVGKITDVRLDGDTAVVTMELRRSTRLPDNAFAQLRQTSLLGEKFVSLEEPPTGTGTGRLGDGDVIPLDRTGRNPEVEEVLGALSLLLNGGGVAQLKTITTELNKALDGREGSARSVLTQVRTLMSQLDTHKQDIVTAIEALNRLAVTANQHMDAIDAALDELPSALDSIDRQRGDLVRMLKALDRLSGIGTRVIALSKTSTIDALQQLTPVLTELGRTGDNFAKSFHVFLTYPFVDEVVGRDPQVARNLHMGDYTNLSVTLDLSLDQLPTILPTLPTILPTLPPLPSLPTTLLPSLPTKLPTKLPSLPTKLPTVSVPTQLPSTVLPTVLPTTLPTLGRAGAAPRAPRPAQRQGRGPTVRQLTEHYDPALVTLLVPGMVTR